MSATAGLSSYSLEIDNGDSGDFSITGIPTSRTTDYDTSQYLVHYDGSYISIYTKSSSSWGGGENDGKLKEGKRTWKIVAVDNAGNSKEASRTLYVDVTSPTLTSVSVDNIGAQSGFLVTTKTKPVVTGTISDNVMPDKVIISFYKQSFFLGIETSLELVLSQTDTLTNSNSATSLAFSLSPSQNLEYGKYQVVVKGIDKAGNYSSEKTLTMQIMTDTQAKTLLSQELTKENDTKINEVSKISLPELEKKAILRREKEANELNKLLQQAQGQFSAIAKFSGDSLAFVVDNVSKFASSAYSVIANTGDAIASQAKIATSTVFSGLIMTGNTIGDGFQALGTTINNAYQQTSKSVPAAIGNTMLALKSGGESVAQAISYANQLAINTLDQTQSNLNEKIIDASYDTRESINALAFFVSQTISGTATTIVSANNAVSDYLNKTEENIQKQIAATHKNTNNTLAQIGERARNGTNVAIRSITKPAVSSKNFADRLIKSVTIAFATFESYMFDSNPTQIANVTIEDLGKDYVVISWQTNHYTHSNKVNYGESLSYGEEAWGENGAKDHKVKITGLKPGSKYYFEVMSQNKNYTYDAYYSFETKK